MSIRKKTLEIIKSNLDNGTIEYSEASVKTIIFLFMEKTVCILFSEKRNKNSTIIRLLIKEK